MSLYIVEVSMHGDGCGVRIHRGIIQVYDAEQGLQRRHRCAAYNILNDANTETITPSPEKGRGVMAGDPAKG